MSQQPDREAAWRQQLTDTESAAATAQAAASEREQAVQQQLMDVSAALEAAQAGSSEASEELQQQLLIAQQEMSQLRSELEESDAAQSALASVREELAQANAALQRAQAECGVWEEEAKQGSVAAQNAAQEREDLREELATAQEDVQRLQGQVRIHAHVMCTIHCVIALARSQARRRASDCHARNSV